MVTSEAEVRAARHHGPGHRRRDAPGDARPGRPSWPATPAPAHRCRGHPRRPHRSRGRSRVQRGPQPSSAPSPPRSRAGRGRAPRRRRRPDAHRGGRGGRADERAPGTPSRPAHARLTTGWPRPPPRTPPSSSGSARKPRHASPAPRKTGTASRGGPGGPGRPLSRRPRPRQRSESAQPRRSYAPRTTLATRPSHRPRRPTSGPRPPRPGPRTHAQRPPGPAKTPSASSTSCAPTPNGNGTRSSPGSPTPPSACPR